MNDITRRYINDLAEKVIEVYGITIPIENIFDVVTKIGGRIEEKIGFDDLYDGTISKEETNNFVIAISRYQSNQRKTFTIAHELGHLFLHMGFRTDKQIWENQNYVYRRFGSSEQEYQANEFAAALLMPRDKYKEVLDENTNGLTVDIDEVARYFHVSVSAAKNRGKFLGYI